MKGFRPKETSVQKAILQYLNITPGFFWRNNTGAAPADYKGKKRFIKYGATGSADIIGVLNGRFVAIECKRPLGPRGGTNGSVQNSEQLVFQANVEAAGGIYIVARSVEDVAIGLKRAEQQ